MYRHIDLAKELFRRGYKDTMESVNEVKRIPVVNDSDLYCAKCKFCSVRTETFNNNYDPDLNRYTCNFYLSDWIAPAEQKEIWNVCPFLNTNYSNLTKLSTLSHIKLAEFLVNLTERISSSGKNYWFDFKQSKSTYDKEQALTNTCNWLFTPQEATFNPETLSFNIQEPEDDVNNKEKN